MTRRQSTRRTRRQCDRNSAEAAHIAIKRNPSDFYERLLGPPNRRLSNQKQLRYGRLGSLAVALSDEKVGMWFDHEAQQGGDFLDLIMRERGVRFLEAKKIVENWIGISNEHPTHRASGHHQKYQVRTPKVNSDGKSRAALRLWAQSTPIKGTPAQSYLEKRTINAEGLDHVLRFHGACPRGKTTSPAMVAVFRDIFTDAACAVHRSFINEDGSKASEAEIPAKMMLGPTQHAAIKISPNEDVEQGLGIAEGIEDALSILRAGWAPVWAVGSAGKIARFPLLTGIEHLTVFADFDVAGRKAAAASAQMWTEAGREVTIRVPPEPFGDWNEVAQKGLL